MTKYSKADLLVKEQKAVHLRSAGYTFEQIAKECGYNNASGAQKAVMRRLMKDISTDVEEIRNVELHRLEEMTRAVYGAALAGDYKAIDRIVKLMERRGRYIGGLEAPQKLELEQTSVTQEEFHAWLTEGAKTFLAGADTQKILMQEQEGEKLSDGSY